MKIKSHITDDLHFTGSSATRLLRFSETDNAYNGGYFGLKGQTNQIIIGVHAAGDQDPTGDVDVVTINRANGFLGINTPTPTAPLHVTGNIVNEGVTIAPTYADFENRLSVGSPSFGGSRLGDSNLQAPSIDTKALNFKDDSQGTKAALFVNADGSVMTFKGFDDGIMVVDFTSAAQDFATASSESTIANSIEHSAGGRYINDQGVQHYHTNGSVVAQSSFQVLQNTGGLSRIKHWVGRYDGTTYDRTYQINTDNTMTFDHDVEFLQEIEVEDLTVNNNQTLSGNFTVNGNQTNYGDLYTLGKASIEGGLNLQFLPVYADDSAASAALGTGDVYQTISGELRIKL